MNNKEIVFDRHVEFTRRVHCIRYHFRRRMYQSVLIKVRHVDERLERISNIQSAATRQTVVSGSLDGVWEVVAHGR